jgi:hypothetical protein
MEPIRTRPPGRGPSACSLGWRRWKAAGAWSDVGRCGDLSFVQQMCVMCAADVCDVCSRCVCSRCVQMCTDVGSAAQGGGRAHAVDVRCRGAAGCGLDCCCAATSLPSPSPHECLSYPLFRRLLREEAARKAKAERDRVWADGKAARQAARRAAGGDKGLSTEDDDEQDTVRPPHASRHTSFRHTLSVTRVCPARTSHVSHPNPAQLACSLPSRDTARALIASTPSLQQ